MTKQTSAKEFARRSFMEMMKDIGTSIPGHILSFDPASQLAQLQIGIARIDVDGKKVTPPPIIECPVYFFGGDYCVEVQIDPGCEGVILFSQRCIDAWVDEGGVANNPIQRFHDFSDAYFLPGIRSQPKRVSNFNNNGIRLRNKAGDQYFWLKNDNTSEIKSPSIKVVADDVDFDCDKLTHKGANIGIGHKHGGVDRGSSQTDGLKNDSSPIGPGNG